MTDHSTVRLSAAEAAPRHSEADLRQRLEEAEATLQAISAGAVDAFVIDGPEGERVYTLEGADRPYRVLVECMQEGALVFGAEGTVLFANRRLAELLQIPYDRLAGSDFYRFLVPSQRPAFENLIDQGRQGRARGEFDLCRSDGSLVPVHLSLGALPLGESPVLCAIVTDLTARKEHEALKRAQRVLQEADRRKDEFLATLAHELRNPLAPIRNALQIQRLSGSLNPQMRMAWDVIDRQVRQMTHLVDDLLDLGRITRDQLTLRRERIDLSLVIRSAVETSQPLVADLGHELIVKLPDQPVYVDGDMTRLSQVFSNLLNNAAKFTDPGGRIELSARLDGEEVVVSVQDNGVGIPRELLSSIFDMFTHIDQGTERSYGGLGIGLTLVRRLVELHGGSVRAYSDGPGHGSVLTVRLPRLLSTVSPPRWNENPAEENAQARYKILIVDDNRDSADMLGAMLGLKGHTVQAVYDGNATFEVGPAFVPDVVLLDLGMPRPDGFEVCRRLRQQSWGANALVIAVTGWGQIGDRRRTREAGFDDHLVKPLEPTVLDAILARHRAPGD